MIKSRKSALKNKFSVTTIILFVFLAVYSLVLIGLLYWGVITSFKSADEFKRRTYQFPQKFAFNLKEVLENFVVNVEDVHKVSRDVGILPMFGYTILYALGCSLVFTVVQAVTAYAAARFNFKFSKILYGIVIVTMIVPLVGTLPSEMELAIKLGLYNRIYGLWIMKANFLGMYFLIFYNMFKAMPASYSEAAKIDGASNWTVMVRIIFPLCMTTFGTVLLINFITFWNDYQTPLLYMPGYPTVSYGLYMIAVRGVGSAALRNAPYRLSASMVVLVPILVIFFIFQKKLLGNLTVGGVKG